MVGMRGECMRSFCGKTWSVPDCFSLFAAVVRVGIPAERIRAARDAGLRASVEEWASKHHEEK
jgi:hypothetical protein